MKKLCFGLILVLMLAGCGNPDVFETMSDTYLVPEAVPPQQTSMLLSEDSAIQIENCGNSDSIYLCDDYCVMVQTFASGDLNATIRSVTGYAKDKLLIMQRETAGIRSYECVWASAGEGGDQLGRMLILDDGSHHYALSVMADAEKAGELTDTWQLLLDSFQIGVPETNKG